MKIEPTEDYLPFLGLSSLSKPYLTINAVALSAFFDEKRILTEQICTFGQGCYLVLLYGEQSSGILGN